MRDTQYAEDDLMGGVSGAGGLEDEEDDDYLDVRTKDILVIHLPDLKVSNFLQPLSKFLVLMTPLYLSLLFSSFYSSSIKACLNLAHTAYLTSIKAMS